MLTLSSNPSNILGGWSMTAARFHDLRYERPNWVLRAQAWSDLATPQSDYPGPFINGSGGAMRPILIPIKIVFEGVKGLGFFWEPILTKDDVPIEQLNPELQAIFLPLVERFTELGATLPSSVSMTVRRIQDLSYEQFIAEAEVRERIEVAYNEDVGEFHLVFEGDHDLQLRITYENATVYLGSET